MKRWSANVRAAVVLAVTCGVGAGDARAQGGISDAPEPTFADPIFDLPPPPPTVEELDARLSRTEDLVLNRQPAFTWGAYIDAGFYLPSGNGAGYVQDFGHAAFPKYAGRYGWVFLGDILSPAVNSRGEVADLGDAPGVGRYDGIHSGGAPSFIANELNLRLRARISATAIASASVNFAPRTGSDFRLGDTFDVDIAQVEWLPTESQRTSVFFGKMEPVIGIEYRDRKSDRRFGITPSLIARYTTGPAVGLKVRSKFGSDDWLVVAGAVTNGSNTSEAFHFYDETDSNAAKTLSGRVSIRLPLPFSAELGGSGSWGAQDRSPSSQGAMWLVGPDFLAHAGPVDLKLQWLRGRSPGDPLEGVYGLNLRGGGYAEADVMLTPTFGLLGRAEYRDARVWLGNERLYLTKSWRATLGVRVVFNDHAVLKAECLHNGEYGGLPQVDNDVCTSSLVLAF